MTEELHPDIAQHYALGLEGDRLATWGRLEAMRTRELFARHLPSLPATVYDIGGGEGAYALPLAAAGYAVHLLDGFGPHIDAAKHAATGPGAGRLASTAVGDARRLPYEDSSADAVLLLGPIYHLVERADRMAALHEARRVLRPGGVLMAAAISRFASTLDGVRARAISDVRFAEIIADDVRDGIHRNPDPVVHPEWFTLAYFHRPEELEAEVAEAGFDHVDLVAVEGVGSHQDVRSMLDDSTACDALLTAIRRLEREPSLLGASAHIMAIAS